jgi:hypothetical protein
VRQGGGVRATTVTKQGGATEESPGPTLNWLNFDLVFLLILVLFNILYGSAKKSISTQKVQHK